MLSVLTFLRSRRVLQFVLGVLNALPVTAYAQQLSGISLEPPQALVGQAVEATINVLRGAGSFYCGLSVSMGDGTTRDIRITEADVPIKISHQYQTPGNYSVTVEGKLLIRGLRTAMACDGRAVSASVLVMAAAAPAAEQPGKDELAEIRRAADAGDSDAMYNLGNMLAQRGNNVEAAGWFRSASERGHVKATNALGFMYEEGRGVPQNYDQANRLYLLAMKKGNSDAMVNRGVMLAEGKGASADLVQAYMHFLLAVAYATDNETRDAALKLRNEIAGKLSKQQISRGQAMADKFAKSEIKQQ